MTEDQSQDIEEVRRQELRRGKGYAPSREEKELWRRRQRQWRDILQSMTWDEVANALSLRPGTPEYAEYYQIWTQYQRDSGEGG